MTGLLRRRRDGGPSERDQAALIERASVLAELLQEASADLVTVVHELSEETEQGERGERP